MGKQTVKIVENALFGITRDGELIGVGLTRENAELCVSELEPVYPSTTYRIIPQPKAEKKKANP
jgi:hypothetical protein